MSNKKNGYSVQYHTKEELLDYTVYFERKGKVIYCTIQNNTFNKSFRGKAVCHHLDRFNESEGRKIAFNKAHVKHLSWLHKFKNRVSQQLGMILHSAEQLRNKNNRFLSKN
jgi:hypothetical protein